MLGPRSPVCEISVPMPNGDPVNSPDVTGVSNSALRSITPARSEVGLAPNWSSTQDSYRYQPWSASMLLTLWKSPTYLPVIDGPLRCMTATLVVMRAAENKPSVVHVKPRSSESEYALPVFKPPVVLRRKSPV
jgi:hypothetical protein